MRALIELRWSILALAVALILALAGMGALGAMLYYACYPLPGPFYGTLDGWHGDWAWTATILAGMLWSLSFVIAGCIEAG